MSSKSDNSATITALAAIIALAIIIPITVMRAWVLLKLWQWYIPYDFMTMKISIGTCFIASILTYKPSREKYEDVEFTTMTQALTAPVLVLSFAWTILQIL